MTKARGEITVYYDGVCPRCIRDRERYERLASEAGGAVRWVDVNGREATLREKGIDPVQALRELHVEDQEGHIHRGLDAYILLMSRVPRWRPLAWLIGLPGLKSLLSWGYRRTVLRRLRLQGRA